MNLQFNQQPFQITWIFLVWCPEVALLLFFFYKRKLERYIIGTYWKEYNTWELKQQTLDKLRVMRYEFSIETNILIQFFIHFTPCCKPCTSITNDINAFQNKLTVILLKTTKTVLAHKISALLKRNTYPKIFKSKYLILNIIISK